MITVTIDKVSEATSNGSQYDRPPRGAYICVITDVTNKTNSSGLVLSLDIASGEYEGHYRELFDRFGWWSLTSFHSYKPKAKPFFLRLLRNIEKSNDDCVLIGDKQTIELNERDLIGKLVGAVIYYEEYCGNDGKIKERAKVDDIISLDDLAEGKFKIPENTKLPQAAAPGGVVNNAAKFEPVNDSEVPF